MLSPKTRVLIVDDDASMARYLSTYLARHNFDVNIVGSGEEAIRMFRVYDPVLVLLDVAMNGMSGIDTLERIKQIHGDHRGVVLVDPHQHRCTDWCDVVEVVDPPCVCPGNDHEIGVGPGRNRRGPQPR